MDLSSYDLFTLGRWRCEFQAGRWPEDFPYPEPPHWHVMTPREKGEHPRLREAKEAIRIALEVFYNRLTDSVKKSR